MNTLPRQTYFTFLVNSRLYGIEEIMAVGATFDECWKKIKIAQPELETTDIIQILRYEPHLICK